MVCKYCGKEKKLIEAHIIPKNFYLEVKTQKYRAYNSTGKYRKCQNGVKDKNILCADCDNGILRLYDNEAYKVFLNKIKCESIRMEEDIVHIIPNTEYDYQKLRKFFISIVWRASISKAPEFSTIDLGKYEDIALKILKNEIHNDNLFKVIIYKEPENIAIKQANCVNAATFANKKAHNFYFAGYRFTIITSIENIKWDETPIDDDIFFNEKTITIIECYDAYKDKMEYLNPIITKNLK